MIGLLRAYKSFLSLIIVFEEFIVGFPRLVGLRLVLPLHELDFVEDVDVIHLFDGLCYFLGIVPIYPHRFEFHLYFFKLCEIDGDVLLG